MPSQSFRVKNGLEVGTGVTISATGIISATSIVVSGNSASTFPQLNVSGISTLGNTVVGGATTQLIVDGNARITGILTIGTSSITFNGGNDSVTIGTGVTIFGNTGIISATEFRGNGANLTSVNASNLGSGTIPDARFPATLPAVSGANLTGIQPFVSGTLMLFQQTAAPTGWTKQTTHNDKALRVVSGSASSGGTTAFSSVMTSRTPAGTVSVSGSNSGGSIANTTDTGSVSGSNSGGSVSNTTLTTTEMPSHSHSINNGTLVRRNVPGANFASGGAGYGEPNELTNNNTGSSGAHGHGFTNPSWSGSISMNAHSHVFTNPSWSGSGSFTGTSMDFAVQYVDLIIASKN